MAFLSIQNISKRFSGLTVVNNVSLDVEEGEIFGLIGPNGAGKSTTLNMIDGSLSLSDGSVFFKGEEISRLSSYRRAARGLGRVFQRDTVFGSFTVIENVMIGRQLRSGFGFKEALLPWSSGSRRKEKSLREEAMKILARVGLGHLSSTMAVNLPHGNQRALALAIAMATEAKLLLLDEPLTGMSGEEIAGMMKLIKRLRDEEDKTILIVEHNMKAVIGLCDRIAVLDFGVKIAEGLPKVVIDNPRVIEAYLGAAKNAIAH